ncbi:hypothetical protein VC83_04759 [Pseudogymnoascus destructans]|uniref:Uncharacterized protein n=1 Tax=Pseudogymnoascus destructans TaxID=655981 RepID=A0A177A7W6_9PEZI|nr:uncharacterized protein VC83_04759 [Pseudogymnoascus destructans]OAF57371.1 hypothetical protein VC83_04759 [Pseudogymnoascus destructans]
MSADEETSIPDLVSSECPTPTLPSSVYSATTDMPSPAVDEFEHPPCIPVAEATNAHDGAMLPSNLYLAIKDNRMAEDLEFNYWEEFIDYSIMTDDFPRVGFRRPIFNMNFTN